MTRRAAVLQADVARARRIMGQHSFADTLELGALARIYRAGKTK